MAAARRELQQQLEVEVNGLRSIQKDLERSHKVRKQYGMQLSENEMVKKELDLLEDEARVLKLIGPVLVPQDLAEAKANVGKRIEYISAEMKRLEGTLKQLELKHATKQDEVLQAQQRLQGIQGR